MTGDPWLDDELTRCAADPDRFNSVVLGRGAYWWRQREACRSVTKYRQTSMVTGNGVGKTYLLAGLALWAFSCHPDCKVILSAPTLGQLEGAVWGEIESAYRGAQANGLPLGGKLRSRTLEHSASWRLECYGQGSVESKSGRHAGDLFAFVDEASGTPHEVDEAIDSLNPSKIVRLGNPLRPEGKFYESVALSGDNPHINVLKVTSLESPDIHLDRSPRGMADRTWLESMRHEYGEDSIWWLSHVLAEFPDAITEGLLPIPWLEEAARIVYTPAGEPWMGIDLGEGTGGDPSVIVVRDDHGICRDADGPAHESSNRWGLETTAGRARAMMDRFRIDPTRVVYDQGGLGTDFDNRLRVAGICGAVGYKGHRDGGEKTTNLRSACHWALRRRLDPRRHVPTKGANGRRVLVAQPPFSLPPELLSRYRAELQGARYRLVGDQIEMEPKADFVSRLKRSPNFLDALAMTYIHPHR